MKYGEYDCECGANVCGDADYHEPKCPQCGKMGSWDRVKENDLVSALDPVDSFDDALISPDDPIPPREPKYSEWHNCKCGVEYTVEFYPNCPDCGLESIPENAIQPFKPAVGNEVEDENLMERFSIAMATMNRYNAMRERQGLPPLSLEEKEE